MRCPSQESVNPSFEERLKAYEREARVASKTQGQYISPGKICACSMAAGAVLGLAQPALSAIVYSGPQNIPLACSCSYYGYCYGSVRVDFTGIGANTDFYFGGAFFSFNYYGFRWRAAYGIMYPTPGNSILASGYMVRNMNAGSPVSNAAGNWDTSSNLLNYVLQLGPDSITDGNFVNTTGYIGVRISAGGGNYYYGWIQYRGDSDFTTKAAGTIVDWAYEDQVNTPIRAGDTGEPIPTLNQWGMIMLAALLAGYGMLRLRKQGEDPVAGA
jgi:hypothetical protein